MKKIIKKSISALVAFMLLICVIPFGNITASAATEITESMFTSKFNSFKKNVYADGSIYTNAPSKTGGYECFGYANEIAKYIYGSYPTNSGSAVTNINSNWKIIRGASAIDSLHIGDIVRFRYGSYDHSIFVYKISGDTVYYTDANGGSTYNKVASQNLSISQLKSYIKKNLIGNTSVVGYVAHYKGWKDICKLTIQYNANGATLSDKFYTVTTDGNVGLWLRSSYSTASTKLVCIPDGVTLNVSEIKTSGGYRWGKTSYNGQSGWTAISEGAVKTHYLSSDTVYYTTTKKPRSQTWSYGSGDSTYGLANYTTFGLQKDGYKFVGWSVNSDGSGTVFDQNDTSLKAEDIYPGVKNNDATVTLYAVWVPIEKTTNSIEIASIPDKTVYYVGEDIDLTGLTIKVNYSDNTSEILEQCSIAEYDPSTPGIKTIVLGYNDLFTTFEVTYKEPTISMDSALAINVGETKPLNVVADPSNATITYSSFDTEVATVNNGQVTAVANGITTVTAEITVNDITYVKQCTVTVGDGVKADTTITPAYVLEEKRVDSNKIKIAVKLNNAANICDGNFTLSYDSDLLTATSYIFGSLLDDSSKLCNLDYQSEGNKIRVTFASIQPLGADGEVISIEFNIKESGLAIFRFNEWKTYNSQGQSVNSSADKAVIGVNKELDIRELTSIAIEQMPNKTEYKVGEALDTTGLKLKLNYNDSTSETVTSGFEISGFDTSTAGIKMLTVLYGGKTATYYITVEDNKVDDNVPQIVVNTKSSMAGKTVDVTISLKNNPGIVSATMRVAYDSDVLTLIKVTDAGVLGSTSHKPELINPYTLVWVNDTATSNFTSNGKIVTLTFEVSENASLGKYPVTVSYDYDSYDIYNVNAEKIKFVTVNGYVEIIDVIIGDVNSDGLVNNLDRMVLTRYLADWDDYGEDSINSVAADVNSDGLVNNLDRMVLTRHLADWDGYEELPYAG